MRVISCASLLFVGVFKMLQGKINAPYLWLQLKVFNVTLLTALASSLVMFHYPIALLICFVIMVLRFSYCMVPMMESYDFSWNSYFFNATFCVVWLLLTISVLTMTFFGTYFD